MEIEAGGMLGGQDEPVDGSPAVDQLALGCRLKLGLGRLH
jgi:hypothetical protein